MKTDIKFGSKYVSNICIYFLSMETDKRFFSRDYCGCMASVENIFRLCKVQVIQTICTCRSRSHAIRFQVSIHRKKYKLQRKLSCEEAI